MKFFGRTPRDSGGKTKAFTLLELLVSIAVLGVLVMMLTQMVGMLDQAITANAQHLDADGQARLVFDRIGADFAARPDRADLGILFSKAQGNDGFSFYSEVPGYNVARPMSLIGYRVQESTAGRLYQLERGATGMDWSTTGSSMVFLPQEPSAPADSDFEVIARGVFRLEFCYILKTANTSASGSATSLSNTAESDHSDVSALVVAIAVLDDKDRKILTDSQIKQISAALGDCDDGQYPIYKWNAALNQANFAAGMPRRAIQGIHIYQRTFRIP